MTGSLRVIDTGLADARWNVAVSAALLDLHAEGRIPDTLRFHRYRRCLLVGASHAADETPRGDRPVVRRLSGGGAVAMTPAILAWDLASGRHPRREDVARALVGAIGRFGLEASVLPPGDIVVAGRKIAGIAGAFEGSSRLHQGALVVAGTSAELAGRFCLPVRPVVSLAELVDPAPGMDEVADTIASAFSDAFGLALRREALGRLELGRAEEAALADAP